MISFNAKNLILFKLRAKLRIEGHKFEPCIAHHKKQDDISYPVFYFVVLMTWTSNCECNLIKFMTNEKIICHAELVSASYQWSVLTFSL